MMGILWYLIVGFFAGLLAKAIVPGENKEPSGCLMISLLGAAGSVLVGWFMHDVLRTDTAGGFLPSLVGATIGAVVIILIARKFMK